MFINYLLLVAHLTRRAMRGPVILSSLAEVNPAKHKVSAPPKRLYACGGSFSLALGQAACFFLMKAYRTQRRDR